MWWTVPAPYILSTNVARRHMTKGAIAVVVAKVYPEPAKVGCRRGPGGALPQPPGSAPVIGVISARHFSSARRSLARPHAEAAIKAAKC